MTGIDGHTVIGLPNDELQKILEEIRPVTIGLESEPQPAPYPRRP